MNKKAMLMFFGTLTLGCAASTSAQAPLCPAPNNLKLTVDQYELKLSDKVPICVTSPGTFKIAIHQPGNATVTIGAGDVTVKAKEETGLKIEGNNNAPINKITVTVEGDAEPGDIFEFWIEVKNVGILDPKVRVIPSMEMLSLKSTAFYDVLDTLDLTLEEANKLVPPRAEAE